MRQRLRELNPRQDLDSLKEHSRLRVPDPHDIRREAEAQRAASRIAPSARFAPATRPANSQ